MVLASSFFFSARSFRAWSNCFWIVSFSKPSICFRTISSFDALRLVISCDNLFFSASFALISCCKRWAVSVLVRVSARVSSSISVFESCRALSCASNAATSVVSLFFSSSFPCFAFASSSARRFSSSLSFVFFDFFF